MGVNPNQMMRAIGVFNPLIRLAQLVHHGLFGVSGFDAVGFLRVDFCSRGGASGGKAAEEE